MTLYDFLSNSDAGDSLTLLSYYVPSLIIAFLIALLLNAILVSIRGLNRKYICLSTASILCCWGIYFLSTASQNMTLTLLGSESPEAAEFAFQKDFKLNLNQAIWLATSNPAGDDAGGQNVRFYAACRIADILESSNRDFQDRIVNQMRDAPIITPGFIGTNSINCVFGDPNQGQPRLTVAEIIRRRLSEPEKQ